MSAWFRLAQPAVPPPTPGERWGDTLSDERMAKREDRICPWEAATDHRQRRGPFEMDVR